MSPYTLQKGSKSESQSSHESKVWLCLAKGIKNQKNEGERRKEGSKTSISPKGIKFRIPRSKDKLHVAKGPNTQIQKPNPKVWTTNLLKWSEMSQNWNQIQAKTVCPVLQIFDVQNQAKSNVN